MLFLLLWLTACQQETITTGPAAHDLFFLQNQGAAMPVLVEGNTASKTMLLVVHGGPGSDAIKTMNGAWMDALEARYGVAYWDQRNAGSTQGGANHNVLTVATHADDLKKLVLLLKHRYGADLRVFLYSHSWGGCLSAAFLTTADNQKLVRGWINLDGATSYPLMDTESKSMQVRIGTAEKAAGRNVAEWTRILDFAQANIPQQSEAISGQFNQNAYRAIKLIADVNPIPQKPRNDARFSSSSLMSTIVNYQSVFINSGMNAELFDMDFHGQLPRLTLPVLNLFGKYDFVVPPAVGQDLLNRIKSADKKLVILNRSAHDPYATEPEAVRAEVIAFVERAR